MITFNVQAYNNNYYRGHAPSNSHGNCWGDQEDALVFTIEQARELVKIWRRYLKIVIAVSAEPLTDEQFKRELFCAKGGSWYDYKKKEEDFSKPIAHSSPLSKQYWHGGKQTMDKCQYCGACRIVRPSGYWQYNCECYDPLKRPIPSPY